MCPNCGTCSRNYNNCDFCKKELPDDCRMYDPVAVKEEEEKKRKERLRKAENEKLLLQKLVGIARSF